MSEQGESAQAGHAQLYLDALQEQQRELPSDFHLLLELNFLQCSIQEEDGSSFFFFAVALV